MKGNIRCKASSWPYARQSVRSFAGEEEMETMFAAGRTRKESRLTEVFGVTR